MRILILTLALSTATASPALADHRNGSPRGIERAKVRKPKSKRGLGLLVKGVARLGVVALAATSIATIAPPSVPTVGQLPAVQNKVEWTVPRAPTEQAASPNLRWALPQKALTSRQMTTLQAAEGLRVMWWNIEFGRRNTKEDKRPLSQNLVAIANSQLAPDVIGLGEYHSKALDGKTRRELTKHYPHHQMLPYGKDKAIKVFSRYPLERMKNETMGYTSTQKGAAQTATFVKKWQGLTDGRAAASFPRPYAPLAVKVGNQTIDLLFVHLNQPWSTIREQSGKIAAGLSLVAGGNNPLIHQARHLRTKLERDYGSHVDGRPLMVLGDFNLPSHVFGVPVRTYAHISDNMKNPLSFSGIPSWPTPNTEFAKKYPEMRIDHGLTNKQLQTTAASVLPISGSDHMPIYFVVKPQL
jgi:endonuclease/exonuclease/phosphatase family metal-dependent hydrolase